MTPQRLAAVAALVLAPVTVAMAVWAVLSAFPRGLVVAGCLVVALGTAWYGVRRRGRLRVLGLVVAGLAFAVSALVVVLGGALLAGVLVLVSGLLTLAAARAAFRVHVALPSAPRPLKPVLFVNPRSGGGKAAQTNLAEEARSRGIEPVELGPGDDLESLARAAVAAGADGLAMAGGDGSQAVIASVAAELGLPYACVPAGTRNHFALDLGVDRDDVVGALDAFVDGGEHVVDLGEVNGRVFVNNVSLGLYAEAVQRPGYREAKLKTLLDTVPDVIGPDVSGPDVSGSGKGGLDLQWVGPGGHEHQAGAVILVSNNRYRLGRAVGSGTRPRIDDGLLGIAVVGAPTGRGAQGARLQRPWREWSATSFEVGAGSPVPAGVDGEAVLLEPPVRFGIRSGVLRVRVAKGHPGASPSAAEPEGTVDSVRVMLRIAAGRDVSRDAG
ncbi:MAG: diacylglycerol/lipid kinase family protein [Actinomycetes bacterium]